MGYKVIHMFTDLQDLNHLYRVGDAFPRPNFKVSEARIRELSGNSNKQGKPLIEKVEDDFANYMNLPIDNSDFEYTKTEINRMSTADLKELAKAQDIDNAEDLKGAELKKILIDKFNL